MTILKRNSHPVHGEIQLPCGQCIECKLERTRQWAVRILHEAQLHKSNYFANLTFALNPVTLEHRSFQLFMKRLRFSTGQKLRYFMCGEYGTAMHRPHFHAILFGLELNDLKLYSQNNGNPLYESQTLTSAWQLGHINVGQVTFESASYVASYCTKKITGNEATDHYTKLDPETGELYTLEPEYARMSNRPGIGAQWIEKFTSDVFNYDHVIVNGREQKAPRYYDKYLERTNPTLLEQHKQKRKLKAQATQGENTPARRKTRERVTLAKHKLNSRTYEK